MAIRVEAGARQVHPAVEVGDAALLPPCVGTSATPFALVPRPHAALALHSLQSSGAAVLVPTGGRAVVRGGRSAFRVMAKEGQDAV